MQTHQHLAGVGHVRRHLQLDTGLLETNGRDGLLTLLRLLGTRIDHANRSPFTDQDAGGRVLDGRDQGLSLQVSQLDLL